MDTTNPVPTDDASSLSSQTAPAPALDMNAEAPTPDMGNEMPPMDGGAPEGDMGGGMEDDDSTMGIINQLNPKDREAVRAYAESMLARDETQNGEDPETESDVPPMDNAPMQESVIFSKRQLDKINENFGPMDDLLKKDRDEKHLQVKKGKTGNKSPFNNPRFN